MDTRLLEAIQRELNDGYGIYQLTDREALLVRLPPQTHRSGRAMLFRSTWLDLLEPLGAARYGRVWLDEADRVNTEHRGRRY